MGTPISRNLQMAWDGHHITMMTMIVINTASPIGKTYDGKQQYGHYDYDLWLLSHPCWYRDWSNGKIEIWRIKKHDWNVYSCSGIATSCCFNVALYTLWLCQHSYWKWPIEIVDLPIKDGDSPSFLVGLPEGNSSHPVDSMIHPDSTVPNISKKPLHPPWFVGVED